MRGVEAQFLALQKGFNELIPQHLLRPFDERELEVRKFASSSSISYGFVSCDDNYVEFFSVKTLYTNKLDVNVAFSADDWRFGKD
jgi:hypothetical protein